MSNYQFQAPPISKTNKIILIAAGVCFLLASILRALGAFSLVGILGLSGTGLLSGLIYQLVTYPFVETQLMSFLFNGLLVWFIGSELETLWGQKVYLRFLALVVIGVGLIYSLVTLLLLGSQYAAMPLHGLTGINFALLVAYALLYPDRQLSLMMIFPMRARTFCLILAGIEAYMAVFSNLSTSWAHLLAMGISFIIIHFQNKPLIRMAMHSSLKTPKKNHLRVVKSDEKDPPKYWH